MANLVIDKLIEKSKYQILNFKDDLIKLYNIIFKFCNNNTNIIISNSNINNVQLTKNKYVLTDIDSDFMFNLYSANPYKDSINLSNIIYKSYSKYVVMLSFLRNKEIVISIDNNKLIKFQLIFLYKNDNEVNDLYNKIDCQTIELNTLDLYSKINKNKKIINEIFNCKFTNNFIELITLTHKLYHPSYLIDFYKKDDYKHRRTFNTIIQNIILNQQNNTAIIKKNINNQILQKIRQKIIKNIHLLKEVVILNKYSTKTDINYNDILQLIIYSKYIDIVKNIINNSIESDKFNIIIKPNSIFIMNDFRFKRINIQIQNKENNDKYTLLYLYNSIDYELIPVISNTNIPHPLVAIRFEIINLFYNKLFNQKFNILFLNETMHKLNILFNLIDDSFKIKYIGNYVDERIEKFKLGSSTYRPWQYEKKNNKLMSN